MTKKETEDTTRTTIILRNTQIVNNEIHISGAQEGKISQIRAVASLEEAEGHQHLAGGHGSGGRTNVSPSAAGVQVSQSREFFLYIFNTKSCILMHSSAPKMGTTSVLSRPVCIGGNEDCRKRMPNEARRAENLGRRP